MNDTQILKKFNEKEEIAFEFYELMRKIDRFYPHDKLIDKLVLYKGLKS